MKPCPHPYLFQAVIALGLAAGLIACSESLGPEWNESPPTTARPGAGEALGDPLATDPDTPGHRSGAGPALLADPCGDPLTVPLLAGRGRMPVGSVTAANDGDALCLTLTTQRGWRIAQVRAVVATAFHERPATRRQSARPTRFPLGGRFDSLVASCDLLLPLAEAGLSPGDRVRIAVQATVALCDADGRCLRKARAWAVGTAFPGRGFGSYFSYAIQACGGAEPCTLTLLAPNGGESVCERPDGSGELEILWETTGDCSGDVCIELLRDGELCRTIAAAAPDTGAFLWEGVERCDWEMEGYRVRVAFLEGEGSDLSDAPFEIEPCGGDE